MYMKTRYHNSQHPARKGGTWGGLMPRTLRVALYLRAGLRCEACGYEADTLRGRACKLSLDHLVPLASGGAVNDPRNLIVLCKRCNSSKRHLSLVIWLKGGGHKKLGLVRSPRATVGLVRSPRATARILHAQARRSMDRHEKLAAILVRDENRDRRQRRAA
jgi:hypothetical protein